MRNEIVYVNATFLCSRNLTGIGRFAIDLCLALKEILGDRIIFLAPAIDHHQEIASKLGLLTVGINKNRVLWEQLDLPFFLRKKKKPLLLNLGNTAPLFYKNQIVTIHDLFYQKSPAVIQGQKQQSQIIALFFKLTIPLIVKNSKHIITVSKYSKKDIQEYFSTPEGKISVVYNSISPIFLRDTSQDEPNPYGKYILGVSSITPRKNFDGLIKAYLAANLNDVKLVIVGGFEEATKNYQLSTLIKGDPRIILTGFVTDQQLVTLYRHSLLFVFPSFMEGFGLPPLEAMACGCATLVSNATSLPEVCGDASFYVDPYDVQSIRQGIVEIINNEELRRDLAAKGVLHAQNYDIHQNTQRLLAILNKYI